MGKSDSRFLDISFDGTNSIDGFFIDGIFERTEFAIESGNESRHQIDAGVPADLDPPQNGPPGPNPLANMDLGVHIR